MRLPLPLWAKFPWTACGMPFPLFPQSTKSGCGFWSLTDSVQALFNGGNRQLILNLADVSNIDTLGSEALLFLAQEYRSAGGKLVLFQLAHAHGELDEMGRLEASI